MKKTKEKLIYIQDLFLKRKKIFIPLMLLVVFLSFIPLHQTHALSAGNVIAGILGAPIAFILFVLSYLLATFFGFLIAVEAWAMQIILQLNVGIVNTAIVQTGFGISLAIANLGFVFAIVVIAIATIIRYESYGLRQTLWRLIVAAILVNFSLQIGRAHV